MTVHREQIVKWEKTNKMQQLDVYYQHFLSMFRASLCPSSGDQDVCYCTWRAASTSHCEMLTPYNAAPHNHYQPHPAEPAQHTTCSNTRLVLLKMAIMMPEICYESVDNKHLTVASCWFSLSLHEIITVCCEDLTKCINTLRKIPTFVILYITCGTVQGPFNKGPKMIIYFSVDGLARWV